ncbi:A24 family peptidase [Scandinavium lactucae]|uniref:A24 family peptidase n=1 Tax=Scandinavium lactucae TaxID=3095028 RepID=A0ABU4QPP4_9ENTR|nr:MULTISPECIES: A24 family peptidase [unclassified Scandinavium]MDX6041266.1 A24 family peptidase [Scandinavium sp. V105_6]MDX6049784.1 A24 family peptidase [Scandinavium sp. V105_1]
MSMYPDTLLLTVSALILTLAAWQLVGQAREFLLANGGPSLVRLQSIGVALVFSVTGMMLTYAALCQHISWHDAGRYIVLLAWGIPMVLLDMRNCWLPFRFTTGFWLTGLLLTLMPASPLSLTEALVGSGAMFIALSFFHGAVWHIRKEEGIGRGDVHLIAALCAWFPWQQACLLSGWAFLLLVLTALLTRKIAQPYAPWLFALLAILAGNFSQPTLSGAL